MKNHRQHILDLCIVVLLCVGIGWHGEYAQPVATAQSTVRTLTTEQADMAAHAVGGMWHNPATSPQVVDFGGGNKDQPAAGMDQWLAAQGQRVVAPRSDVVGDKKYLVMRVYFNDKTATSYYAKDAADEASLSMTRNVVDDLMTPLNTLWQNTSYGKISISWDVTDLYQISGNRSAYITNHSDGDLSEGGQFGSVIQAAVASIPAGYNFNDYAGVLVFMADSDTASGRFHRGQATQCNTNSLALPGVANNHDFGCVVMSENPGTNSVETYGRMGHEFGHAFQQAGPAHPSNYNNPYELMDSNYPGQTGAFEKLSSQGFPGWLPPSQYSEVSKNRNVDRICLRIIERAPSMSPVPQVIKIPVTSNLYYLITARDQVLGDELNAHYNPAGIPDKGILVELVNLAPAAGGQIVTVVPKSGDYGLFHKGDSNNNIGNSISMNVLADAVGLTPEQAREYYCMNFKFGASSGSLPDAGMRPWREEPGNSYETTDIWVDSPLNGYGTFSMGTWNDIYGGTVPRGNGDIPAVGSINRVYARVRNFGTVATTDVKVTIQITDPAGMGIAGSNGWVNLGVVDKNSFPALASIAPGGFTDVYIDWTPDYTLTADQIAAGVFDFHTCLRVLVETPVADTFPGNQDGDGEQENIFQFEATPVSGPTFTHSFTLFNDDMANPKTYHLAYNNSSLPANWQVMVNDSQLDVTIPAGDSLTVPVVITATGSAIVGSDFTVQVNASSIRDLTDTAITDPVPTDPSEATAYWAKKIHLDDVELGGVDFTVAVRANTQIDCKAYSRGSQIEVIGSLDGFEGIHQAGTPLRAYAQIYDQTGVAIPLDDRASGDVGANGVFRMNFSSRTDKQSITGGTPPQAKSVRCLFTGTHLLASSGTRMLDISATLPPTETVAPWAGVSQFHANLTLNQFLPPLSKYSDQVPGLPANNPYICPVGRCPLLINGVHGRAVQFNDASDSFLQSTNPVNLGSTFAVSLWAKRNRGGMAETLVSHGINTTPGHLFNMGFDAQGNLVCSTYDTEFVSDRAQLDDGDWHHYVCVIDADMRYLYIDGQLNNTESGNPINSYAINDRMVLGRRPDRAQSFSGALDDVRVYTTAITAGVVNQLYELDPFAPSPVSHLTFNDIAITDSGVTAACGGGTCPVVYYPDPSWLPRPLERVAAMQLAPNRALTYSALGAVAGGSDSTLLFWARFDDGYSNGVYPDNSTRQIAKQVGASALNRPAIGWNASTHTISFTSLAYTWTNYQNNTWHHFGFVKQAGTLQIYIDGNKVAEGPANPLLLPFRVAVGSSLVMGNAYAGEMAAVELSNLAFAGDTITDRYANGFPANNVSPTLTFTVTPTPSVTAVPIVTLPALNLSKTVVALIATSNARNTQIAIPFVTMTRVIQLNQTAMAIYGTKWANFDKTNTAVALKTPIPTKRLMFTFVPILSTLTMAPATKTPSQTATLNKAYSATRTMTKSATVTASTTATPSATATATTVVVATRTKIATPTLQPSVTESNTATNTASTTMTSSVTASVIRVTFTASKTPNPNSTATNVPSNTATATSTKTATAIPTRTPGVFGKDMVAVTSLPKGMLFRALQHISDNKLSVSPDWDTATIADMAVPFYRPDIDNGDTPAYYEIAVFSDVARSKQAGFIMLTNRGANGSPHDFPITHWDSKGYALSKQLVNAATKMDRAIPSKLWKLDTLGYVAVQNDQIVSNIGTIPALLDGLSTSNFDYYANPVRSLSEFTYTPAYIATDDGKLVNRPLITTVGPQASEAKSVWRYTDNTGLTDFSQYAKSYADSFAPLITQLTTEATRPWGIEDRIISPRDIASYDNYSIPVPAGGILKVVIPIQGITIKNLIIDNANVESYLGAGLDTQTVAGFPVLTVTGGSMPTTTLPRMIVTVVSSRGSTLAKFTFHLIASPSKTVVRSNTTKATRSWSNWSIYWVGGSNSQTNAAADQRDYNQWDIGGGCQSGCGPTAWMMLFGWADYKSSISGSGWGRWNTFRAGGNNLGAATGTTGVAPKAMSNDVKTAILYIRNQVGTFCVSGSGATTPWDMNNARYYLSYVGTGMGFAESHNIVGYHEDRLMNYAINEIAQSTVANRRPVVIGTGWLSHYPVAYGYAVRTRPEAWDEGWFDGDDVVYQQQFYVNNGWGGQGNGWVSAGTWFAGRVRP